MAKTVSVFKASPTIKGYEVESVQILIDGKFPDIPTTSTQLEEMKAAYQHDGRVIAEALWDTLPSGTFDQVLLALLEHKASLFRGPFGK